MSSVIRDLFWQNERSISLIWLKEKEADRKNHGLTTSESGQDWATWGPNAVHKKDQHGGER